MAMINGKKYSKSELLRYVGNISALSSVRSSELSGGKSDKIKIHEVTAGDVSFTLNESKNLDVIDLRYKGLPINFVSSIGTPVNSALSDPHRMNFLFDNAGGMLYTGGYTNVGSFEEDGEPFHGRARNIPAEKISIISEWKDDDYIVGVKGEIREAGLFKQNVVNTRTVTTSLGSKTVCIQNCVENQGFQDVPLMNLYHINCGFPIVTEGTCAYIAYDKAEPMNDEGKEDFDNRYVMPAPTDGKSESLTMHHLLSDENGDTYAAVYNKELGRGLMISFKTSSYPLLAEWKCMGPGCYIMGMLPTTNGLSGQKNEIEKGTVRFLKPFEKAQMNICLTVLDGDEDFAMFQEKLAKCTK